MCFKNDVYQPFFWWISDVYQLFVNVTHASNFVHESSFWLNPFNFPQKFNINIYILAKQLINIIIKRKRTLITILPKIPDLPCHIYMHALVSESFTESLALLCLSHICKWEVQKLQFLYKGKKKLTQAHRITIIEPKMCFMQDMIVQAREGTANDEILHAPSPQSCWGKKK